jgi:ParB-like chromosome segregation protein Spo0J
MHKHKTHNSNNAETVIPNTPADNKQPGWTPSALVADTLAATVTVGETNSSTGTTNPAINPTELTKLKTKPATTHLTRRTEELRPHPLNESIYADGADEKLIQSIREVGIIQQLIIDDENRIISGHRRWQAARALKIRKVPVQVMRLENELDIEVALIEANQQRVKTNEQRAREAAEIYRIEQAKARERQINANPGGTLPAKSPEGVGDARDLAGRRIGIGGKKVEQSVQVIEVIDRLINDAEHDAAENIRTELNKYSVSRAFNVARETGHIKGVIVEPPTEDDFIQIERWKKMTAEEQMKALAKQYVKTQFNFQETDGIEWAKWSWNPITGCLHNCEYCYARDIANRMFGAGSVPAFYPGRLLCPQNTKLPAEAKTDIGYKNVFVCSMADLFGKWMPSDLIQRVLDAARQSPEWNNLISAAPVRI